MADIPYTRQSMDDTADCTARGGTSAVKDPLIMLATSMQSMAHSVHIIARSTEDNTRANAEIATSLNEVGRFMKENAEASQRTADAISFLAHDYRIVHSQNKYSGEGDEETEGVNTESELISLGDDF